MQERIAIPVDSQLIGELFLRAGPKADVVECVDYVLRDFLERTANDGDWSAEYYSYRARQVQSKDFTDEYGDPAEGYYWTTLFLPNGTSICMEYKKEKFYARVKFGKIEYDGQNYSASELASKIASGTSRNAWRDLLIKRPSDVEWTLADDLRRLKK